LCKLDTGSTKIAVALTGRKHDAQAAIFRKSDHPHRNLRGQGWNKWKELYGCGFIGKRPPGGRDLPEV